jgi:hypothetical protein
MSRLPKAPKAPILLVTGGLSTVIALLVYLLTLVKPSRWRLNLVSQYRSRPLPDDGKGSDTESLRTLVDRVPPPQPERNRTVSRMVLLLFVCTGFGFSTAASILQVLIVRDVKRAWNSGQAKAIGMELDVGLLLYSE